MKAPSMDDAARPARARIPAIADLSLGTKFVGLTAALGVAIEKSVTLDRFGRPFSLDPRGTLANLLAEQGLFVLSRRS
jgi:hypothetical protein